MKPGRSIAAIFLLASLVACGDPPSSQVAANADGHGADEANEPTASVVTEPTLEASIPASESKEALGGFWGQFGWEIYALRERSYPASPSEAAAEADLVVTGTITELGIGITEGSSPFGVTYVDATVEVTRVVRGGVNVGDVVVVMLPHPPKGKEMAPPDLEALTAAIPSAEHLFVLRPAVERGEGKWVTTMSAGMIANADGEVMFPAPQAADQPIYSMLAGSPYESAVDAFAG